VSRSVSQVCDDAAAGGIECGPVIDECGRSVSCDAVPGFGCASGETCSASQECLPVAATPPAATPPSATPPGTTKPPIEPPTTDTLPAPGDPGDGESASEGDPAATTTSGKAARSGAPTASAGCSVSSRTDGRDGLHLVGAAVALAALRRRKRR
jgi:MYXO-CTERM domain-containing protein